MTDQRQPYLIVRRRLLRRVMEEQKIMLLADEETNDALIKLAGARGVS